MRPNEVAVCYIIQKQMFFLGFEESERGLRSDRATWAENILS